MNGMEEPLTLLGLNSMVRAAINDAMSLRYWVTGELSEVRETAAGHCYIELIQRDEATGELVAKARGTVWSRIYTLLRPYFLEQTGQPFAAGLKVLLQVTVGFHELYGYALDVCDIEPAYTVGDMARQRMLVIKRLTEEGVIDLNKELPFPLLPQRVAVISSSTAAGYGDFCDQLQGNKYGFVFYPHLFPSPMQGNGVEQGIIDALDRIAQNLDMWDVVVIIRGGGATSELSCFDTYDLANNCAQFPLPIITGIGHQRDDTVVDMVAHTRAKTPTAAAELLIHAMSAQAQYVDSLKNDIALAVSGSVDNMRRNIQTILHNLPMSVALYLQQQQHKLALWENTVNFASPRRILELGYTLTTCNGKVVRSSANIVSGDVVVTHTAEGNFSSIVTDKTSDNE